MTVRDAWVDKLAEADFFPELVYFNGVMPNDIWCHDM